MSILLSEVSKYPHHEKKEICASRAKYREGRRDTCIKVYTINQESCYLLIQNVPSINTKEELKHLCEQFGFIEDFYALDEYPSEEYTDVYLVKYTSFPAARVAKKQLDDRSFFGGTLHVCYAPEFETVQDTRNKLIERRKYVASKLRSISHTSDGDSSVETKKRKSHKEKPHGTDTFQKRKKTDSTQYMTYVWAGKEYTVPVTSSTDIPLVPDNQCEVITNLNFKCNTELEPEPESNHDANKDNTQFFVPRQLVQVKNKSTSKVTSNQEKEADKIVQHNLTSTENETTGYSYDKTMDSIRQKLSSFSAANLTVNLRGKTS